MGLRDLPVLPGLSTDKVRESYVGEIHKVESAEQLKVFVDRWRPLFKLEMESDRWKEFASNPTGWVCQFKTKASYQSICDGTLNIEEAFRCLKKGMVPVGAPQTEGEICEHGEHFSCAGMHLALPIPLLQADFVGNKFGVGTDLALIQANGGWGEYEEGRHNKEMDQPHHGHSDEEEECQSTSSKESTAGSPTSTPPK